MIEQNIVSIVKACDGIIINRGNMETVNEISTDTRTIKKGNLFVPLIGENFDGHIFIGEAIKKGASAILVQEDRMENIINADGVNIIQVKDTLKALTQIAHYYKSLFDIPFIGVTGSVGKTTAKDLIAGVYPENIMCIKTSVISIMKSVTITLFNLNLIMTFPYWKWACPLMGKY